MKVLISRPDTIGNAIMALHGVKQLKSLFPEWEIWMHASPHALELLRCVKQLDGVVSSLDDVNPVEFDAVVDLISRPETAYSLARRGFKKRYGNGARWFRSLYHKTVYIRRSKNLCNEAEYNWQFIRRLHPSLKYRNLELAITAADFKRDEPIAKERAVVLQPQTIDAHSWTLSNWLGLASAFLERGQHIVFLLDAAEQAHQEDLEAFCKHHQTASVVLADSARSVLKEFLNASAYVGCATGLHHLAAACGLNGIAFHATESAQHPYRWAPFHSTLSLAYASDSLSPEKVIAHVLDAKPLEASDNALARMPISAFVVCKNEEKNISRCLKSLSFCDEVVVVDSGSIDETVSLARSFTDRVLYRAWNGHSEQKQFALSQCRHAWILNVDADEEVSMELKGRILRFLQDPGANTCDGFEVSRLVSYLDIWWDRGGWHPEYRLRFFNRDKTEWGGVDPHEKAIVHGSVGRFRECLYHYTYEDISHQIRSLNNHSSLSAACLYREGKRCYIWNLILNPSSRFLKFFIVKRGFLHGIPGFLVACIEAQYTFIKYMKLWNLQRTNEQRTPPVDQEAFEPTDEQAVRDGQQQGSPVR